MPPTASVLVSNRLLLREMDSVRSEDVHQKSEAVQENTNIVNQSNGQTLDKGGDGKVDESESSKTEGESKADESKSESSKTEADADESKSESKSESSKVEGKAEESKPDTLDVQQGKGENPNIVRPSLRGIYEVKDSGKGQWKGKWGMNDFAFRNGGVLSSFEYESHPADTPVKNSRSIRNAYFTGHFMMGSSVPGNSSTRHDEANIYFEFSEHENTKLLKVVGNGSNQFGHFELDGTFDVETRQLICYRLYVPKNKKRNRSDQRRKSSRPSTSLSTSSSKAPRSAVKRVKVEETSTPVVRASRIRRTPSHLLEDVITEETNVNPFHKFKIIVQNLLNNDKEGWFSVPVDAEALGLTTYHTVIKKPMDLGTVHKKLESKQYKDTDEIVQDIRLVFKNACTFNPSGHPVHRVARQHLALFESELKKLDRDEEKKSNRKKSANRSKTDTGSRRRNSIRKPSDLGYDMLSDDEGRVEVSAKDRRKKTKMSRSKSISAEQEDSSAAEMKMLRKQVEMMNKQIEMMQQMQEQNLYMNSIAMNNQAAAQTISAPPVTQAKKREVRPLSYQEKRQLGQDIHKLPGEMIQGVIQIIQESGAALNGDDDEVELDIEALDTPALKKLQKYVRKCLSKARSKKLTDDIDSMVIG